MIDPNGNKSKDIFDRHIRARFEFLTEFQIVELIFREKIEILKQPICRMIFKNLLG